MSWWREAVIYQIYPRSFADADGDGVGDLPGITARLDHVAELGADAVWLSPFYASPHADAGYDVADYRAVDPLFGRLEDADAMLARAHELGLRVIVDLVPNHTSDEHAWFRAALAAGPGSPERARYVFRDGRDDGQAPPNDWRSVFGGPAWSRVTEPDGAPGQWYLHLFDAKQPDLDWTHPDVHEEFRDVLRFWLRRGVDGFRVDVAHGLVKDPALPDFARDTGPFGGSSDDGTPPPMWDQDGVHDIYRDWRRVLDEFDGDRVLVAEAWVKPQERLARYVRDDEMHQAFNFEYLETPWRAADQREVIQASLDAMEKVGAPATWVLSNHDVLRHATRLALEPGRPRPNGIGPGDPQPDTALGMRRARAATLTMLALPGSAYLYQGEELGLPEHTTLDPEVRQDPTFARSDGVHLGRDGCRVPMAWEAGAPALGFSPTGRAWLPQPDAYAELAVDQQEGVEGSTLELYRETLRLRRRFALGTGTLTWSTELDGGDVLAFDNGPVGVVANLGESPVRLPPGVEVLVASGELVTVDGHPAIPTDVTAWIA